MLSWSKESCVEMTKAPYCAANQEMFARFDNACKAAI
jgi:hypothetical protein